MTDSIPVPPVVPVLAYRDPVATLREKMTLWAGRKLKTEEVVYIMKTISREILEEENLKKKGPMARTFGHLCLHHRLDRATPGGRALVDVAEATPLHDANDPRHDNDWLTDFANYELSSIGCGWSFWPCAASSTCPTTSFSPGMGGSASSCRWPRRFRDA
jgi:hypothetical protein